MLFNVQDVKKDIILGQKLPEFKVPHTPWFLVSFLATSTKGHPKRCVCVFFFRMGILQTGAANRMFEGNYQRPDTFLWHIYFWLTNKCCIGNRWLLTLNWCNGEKQEKSWKDMGVVQQVRLPTYNYMSVGCQWTVVGAGPFSGLCSPWRTCGPCISEDSQDAILTTRIMTWEFWELGIPAEKIFICHYLLGKGPTQPIEFNRQQIQKHIKTLYICVFLTNNTCTRKQ